MSHGLILISGRSMEGGPSSSFLTKILVRNPSTIIYSGQRYIFFYLLIILIFLTTKFGTTFQVVALPPKTSTCLGV